MGRIDVARDIHISILKDQSCAQVRHLCWLYDFVHTCGILSLCSLSALTLHTMATMPAMMPLKIAVFVFQFAGCAYQPPAGDQTSIRASISTLCLNPHFVLALTLRVPVKMNVSIYPVAMPLTATTHDIFPPPLLNSCVGLIVGEYVSPLYYRRGGGSDVGGAGLLSGLELAGCSGVLGLGVEKIDVACKDWRHGQF